MRLIDEILSRGNMLEALKAVKQNKGASGIDKITVGELDEYFKKNWQEIKTAILNKKYKPQPVRRVYIPKSNGKKRPLGIPTVGDRVIQQAIARQLTRIYDPIFSEYSHGFRPNRSCHTAMNKVLEYLNDGYEWVIDLDYADDCNIFVKSEMAANRVMKSVISWLERKLFLKVSAEKTKIVRPTKSSFLGFGFWKSTDGWKCKPLNDRKARLYAKCKTVLVRKRAAARPLDNTFRMLNWIIRGWINYYRIGNMKVFLQEFGEWVRHKVRVVIVKQWKKPKTVYRNLMILNRKYHCGMSHEEIYKVANSRLGLYKRCAGNVVNYLLAPKVLATANKSRPGLVDPLSYYLSRMQ